MNEQVMSVKHRTDVEHHHYDLLLKSMESRIREVKEPLFTTGSVDLMEVFLNTFKDPRDRQYYNCHACRTFMNRYGGLVTIDADGYTHPAVWDLTAVPEYFQKAIGAVIQTAKKSGVTGCFYSKEPILGTIWAGGFNHFAVPNLRICRAINQTAFQLRADKLEDFRTLSRAIADFPLDYVSVAVGLLRMKDLYRSEKVLGPAEWFESLLKSINGKRGRLRKNIIWKHVGSAPPGFCHIRTTMVGTLLEDFKAGLPLKVAEKRFEEKMHPLQYQRPQAAPKAGNIAQAEKIVQQLGIADSLKRRYARFEEIQTIWTPPPVRYTHTEDGVFSHLLPKKGLDLADLETSTKVMTWVKFERDMLPIAEEIFYVPPASPMPYAAFMTQAVDGAKPIIQWDEEENRNPVSWYLYNGGSSARHWNLDVGSHARVKGIAFQPNQWSGKKYEHQGKGVMFILEGAYDTQKGSGLAIFPEILKTELRSIRSTIEAYSKAGHPEGREEGDANGILIQDNETHNRITFKVVSKGVTYQVSMDRWE